MSTRIKFNNVEYRKGFIEITPGIHDGCINLESWGIDGNVDLSKLDIRAADFPEDGITGNTEIELSCEEAQALVHALQNAISVLRAGQ